MRAPDGRPTASRRCRVSWERACRIADAMPVGDPGRPSIGLLLDDVVCHRLSGASGRGEPRPVRSSANCARVRGQDLAGSRHDRAGHRARVHGACGRGVGAGFRTDGTTGIDRRAELDLGVGVRRFHHVVRRGRVRRAPAWSQTVVDLADGDPTRAPVSAWARRWQLRWHSGGLPGGGWDSLGGTRILMTP